MLENITRSIAAKIIEENLDSLVRFAFFRLGDMTEAEDAVHDIVLKILDNPPSLFKAGNLKSYIYKAIYNICQDRLRSSSRNVKVSIDVIEEPICNEEEELDLKEAQRLYELLDNIPAKESEIIRMNVIDELSFAEISRITNIPVSTVKYRFKCGMTRMRNIIFDNKSQSHG